MRQKYTMEKRPSLQQVVLGKLVNHLEKNETRTLSNTIHKNKIKWIKDLDVRLNTIELLEGYIGRTLFHINHSKSFLTHLL